MCSLSEQALRQRLYRADRKNGIMMIPGHGHFFVRKPGKSYQIIKINPDESSASTDKELSRQVLAVLKQQAPHLCDECRENIAEPMMKTAKENL
jgi:hypothetical protein